MSVAEVIPRNDYVGNGSVTAFAYTFRITAKAELEVLADGVALLLDSNYTVSGVGDAGGGTVTITSAPAQGVAIAILRKQPVAQSSTYQLNEDFPSLRLMQDLDKVVMGLQQIWETLGRAVKFAKKSLKKDIDIDDPINAKFLKYDSALNKFVWAIPTNAGALTSPVAIADGGTGGVTATDARANLGVPGLTVENTFTKSQHWAEGAAVASASTLTPGTDGNFFHVTGTIGVTQIAAAAASPLFLTFDDVLTLTHDVTKLILRDGINVNTAAGDVFTFVFEGGIIWREIFRSQAPPSTVLGGHLFGLGISNGADTANDINIAIGEAVSDDALIGNRTLMSNLSILTKQLDAVWSVGHNAGGLDTGAVADNTYHVYLIKRPDTGVVDALFSLSATAPTMPANYTKKRRIGSIVRASSAILSFTQDGDLFERNTSLLDINTTNPGISAVLATLSSLPTGINIEALFIATLRYTGASGTAQVYFSDPATVDVAPSATVAPLAQLQIYSNTVLQTLASLRIRTNTSAQVRYRASASDGSTVVEIAPTGWIDRRGRG